MYRVHWGITVPWQTARVCVEMFRGMWGHMTSTSIIRNRTGLISPLRSRLLRDKGHPNYTFATPELYTCMYDPGETRLEVKNLDNHFIRWLVLFVLLHDTDKHICNADQEDINYHRDFESAPPSGFQTVWFGLISYRSFHIDHSLINLSFNSEYGYLDHCAYL